MEGCSFDGWTWYPESRSEGSFCCSQAGLCLRGAYWGVLDAVYLGAAERIFGHSGMVRRDELGVVPDVLCAILFCLYLFASFLGGSIW